MGRIFSAFEALVTPLAMTIPYLGEEPHVTDEDKQGMIQWAKNRGSLWDGIKSWLTETNNELANLPPTTPFSGQEMQRSTPSYPAVPQQLKGNIEVVIKDDRVQVNRLRVNAPGITLSAHAGITSVEQN